MLKADIIILPGYRAAFLKEVRGQKGKSKAGTETQKPSLKLAINCLVHISRPQGHYCMIYKIGICLKSSKKGETCLLG